MHRKAASPFSAGSLRRSLVLAPFVACAIATPLLALADDRVVREYVIPLDDIDEIEFHASAGSMDIVPISADEVRLVLEIESDERGWFKRKRDVSDVELKYEVRGKRLVLRQTAKGTNTEWSVQLPAVPRTSIEMGVGNIDAEFGATELNVELGVGEVEVTLPESSTGEIDISVGVGDARLRGARSVDRERAFISQDVRGRGEGTLDARIKLGVGEAKLRLD